MSHTRPLVAGFGALLAGLVLLGFDAHPPQLWAQSSKKPRVEEEEPEPSKVPRKVDEIVPKKSGSAEEPSKSAPPVGKFDFAREAARTRNPHVRALLDRLAVPYDTLLAARGATSYRIALMPESHLPEGKFSYFELAQNLKDGVKREMPTSVGFSLVSHEERVLDEVNQLLDPANAKKYQGTAKDDLQELAVQILQTTRRQHATHVEQKIRQGKDWEPIDEKLKKRIIQIRREQLQASVTAKDWHRADAIALELAPYGDDAVAKKEIYRLLLRKALESLKAERDEDYLNLREALTQYDTIANGEADDLTRSARSALDRRASNFVEAAKKQAEQNQTAAAFATLKSAEALAPELPGITTVRNKLRDRILYVGVRRLPEHMSPATARDDAERWAVDLMFESLMQSVPDAETGRRFRPLLATGLPELVPLGREFELARNAKWADGKPLDARDVFGTLELLQKNPSLPGAEGVDLIDTTRVRIDDPMKVRLGFRQGMLEPLARTNFKVLPARHLRDHGGDVENDAFSRSPFGSGPYRFEGIEQESANRPAAVFRLNPYYSQRAGKFGLPNLREIRFVVPDPSQAPTDIAEGRLHLVLDVSPADVARYRDDPQTLGKVSSHKLTLNRRVYMLAVNHRRSSLQNVDLRRGLGAAIDREAILQDVFRPEGSKDGHLALTGPFPLQSWATPEKARRPEAAIFNRSLAGGLLAAAAGRDSIRLSLIYPDDDPLAARACDRIREQVEAATKKTANDAPAVVITPQPVPYRQFAERVHRNHDYELAYVPHDYADDLFSLSPLFDPDADGIGGRNFTGYLSTGTKPQNEDLAFKNEFDAVRKSRDFRDKVREGTWKLHSRFLARMPFIPLWQLDRHVVVHNGLELNLDGKKFDPARLDPAVIFTGVEGWRLR